VYLIAFCAFNKILLTYQKKTLPSTIISFRIVVVAQRKID